MSDYLYKGGPVAHLIAGYPDLKITESLVRVLKDKGPGMIIFEIPFSDPIAGGPEMQGMCSTALSAGVNTDLLFDMVKSLRAECDVPMAIISYYNPVFRYGGERFVARCAEAGIQYLMVPDLPLEERDELRPVCKAGGVILVPMLAPTFKDRMERIMDSADGLVYIMESHDSAGCPEGYVSDLEEMADLAHAHGAMCIKGSGRFSEHADGCVCDKIMEFAMKMKGDCVEYIRDNLTL